MQKPLVFISHITEEKEIASALKKLVQSTFLNMIDVSSDPTSIKMGGKWLDEITHALKTCAVEIILASPESVKRPWVNFEGGSGWVRDIPVIPLCHSEMIPSKLPPPLGTLQAATATEVAELKLIFPVLADAVGCTLPQIDFSEFISVVKEFEATSRQITWTRNSSMVDKQRCDFRAGPVGSSASGREQWRRSRRWVPHSAGQLGGDGCPGVPDEWGGLRG